MKLRVAVIYGGRSGEHEVSVRSARAILDALDPAKYEPIEYFIDQQGKWLPKPILPEPGAQPTSTWSSRPARHLRRGRHRAGPARARRPALRRRGRPGVLRLHGQGHDETCLPGTDVAGRRLRRSPQRGQAERRRDLRAPAASRVRQAGQPRLLRRHLQSPRPRRAGAPPSPSPRSTTAR